MWYVASDDVERTGAFPACAALLSPEESCRAARYRFEVDRNLYVVGRALVRTTLSRYADVAPAAWTFEANEYGKPHLDQGWSLRTLPGASRRLRFNLTHTRGAVACIVALDCDVGVDVEDTTRPIDFDSLSPEILAPAELAEFRALPQEQRCVRFFQHWTLKEAYLKARGVGLAGAFRDASFRVGDLAGDLRVRSSLRPPSTDVRDRWHFESFVLPEHHVGAVAIRKAAIGPMEVTIRRTLPVPSADVNTGA